MALANNLRIAADSSFEETYKTAYSHGLEAIYALENVDPKSIRRIEKPVKKEPLNNNCAPKRILKKQHQLEFDLGGEYRNWIPSFIKNEPIQVLELSSLVERCLIANGKKILKDILEVDLQTFIFFKGMGQGHIEEIKYKLSQYVEGTSLDCSEDIDFSSWLRTLVAALDRKKTSVALQPFHLNDLFPISPLENGEINRLTLEKRQEWIEEMHLQFQQPSRKQSVISHMKEIVDVFIRPWMRKRLGIAMKYELEERLQKTSVNGTITSLVLQFYSHFYYNQQFPLHNDLQPVSEHIYCVDEIVACHYHQIVKKAFSFFYKSTIQYPLKQLIQLLEKEFACCWQGFPEGFVEKVLLCDSHFQVRKDPQNILIVTLS